MPFRNLINDNKDDDEIWNLFPNDCQNASVEDIAQRSAIPKRSAKLIAKVIIEKSRDEGSLMEQDTIDFF